MVCSLITSKKAESILLEKANNKQTNKNPNTYYPTSVPQSHMLTIKRIILQIAIQDISIHPKDHRARAEQWESLRSDAASTVSKINSSRKLTPLCIKAGAGRGVGWGEGGSPRRRAPFLQPLYRRCGRRSIRGQVFQLHFHYVRQPRPRSRHWIQ